MSTFRRLALIEIGTGVIPSDLSVPWERKKQNLSPECSISIKSKRAKHRPFLSVISGHLGLYTTSEYSFPLIDDTPLFVK
ncbi:MAG: hypothetical protein B6245_23175 [Desulfobacteraceae bacterium 4572_88]|nr:MAG: hypothetical protein B6245_23175 [Desulfobacteraceae bacterium 4572_88]